MKYLPQKIPYVNITNDDKFSICIYLCTRCSGTAYITTKGVKIFSRQLCRALNLQHHKQRCARTI